MIDPLGPPTHHWTPPKLSAEEVTELTARWEGCGIDVAVRRPAFDRTPEGRTDLRYIPIAQGKRKIRPTFNRSQFRNCDFTGANMDWLLLEHCLFENCIFDRAVMSQLSEKGSTFTACAFVGTDMRYASLGSDWNNSKPGEFESVYRDCMFQDMKLAKLLVEDPIFLNCRFVFKRLKTVGWECAGFWGCRFEGAFEDMQFRGEYYSDNSRLRKGHPQKAGLHATSFRDAKLRFIDLRDGYPVETVEMPADGEAFIADFNRIVAELDQIATACPDDTARALLAHYVSISRSSKEAQRRTIISRYDMFRPHEPENEAAGTWVYRYLKEHYRAA